MRHKRPRSWAQLGVLRRLRENGREQVPAGWWFRNDGMEHAQPWFCVSRESIVFGFCLGIATCIALSIGLGYLLYGVYQNVKTGRKSTSTTHPDYVTGDGVKRLFWILVDDYVLSGIIMIIALSSLFYYLVKRHRQK
jgi:hypothetical protein